MKTVREISDEERDIAIEALAAAKTERIRSCERGGVEFPAPVIRDLIAENMETGVDEHGRRYALLDGTMVFVYAAGEHGLLLSDKKHMGDLEERYGTIRTISDSGTKGYIVLERPRDAA